MYIPREKYVVEICKYKRIFLYLSNLGWHAYNIGFFNL